MINSNQISIDESGVTFGPFLCEDCFKIENSLFHENTGKEKINICEFLLLRQGKNGVPVIWVVEAKSSSPNKSNNEEVEKKDSKFKYKFDEFIEEIRIKLTNGFLLGMAACFGRHSSVCPSLIPIAFNNIDFSKTNFCFVLIIPRHKDDWLMDLKYELELALKPLVKSWNLPPASVKVWNEQLAKEHGFIKK